MNRLGGIEFDLINEIMYTLSLSLSLANKEPINFD